MRVDAGWQNLAVAAFITMWLAGTVAMFFRYRAKQRAYLRRFPPVEGVPLDMYLGGDPFGEIARAIFRALWRRQSNPELEQLRRAVWQRYRQANYWVFGFPILYYGLAALLLVTGIMRLVP